jgi:uncharacterized protein YbgA (DUF1722 family)
VNVVAAQDRVLANWTALNDALRTIDEKRCRQLLEREKNNKRRVAFLMRIYGKFNQLRCDRERRELLTPIKKEAHVNTEANHDRL